MFTYKLTNRHVWDQNRDRQKYT